MDYLVRKISRGKWELQNNQLADFVPADAITACLRTHENTISTWESDGSKASIDNAVLAMAAVGNTIEKMDVVLITKAQVASLGIALENTPMEQNPVLAMRNAHIDLVNIEADRLAGLSKLIAGLVRSATPCRLYNKSQVEKLIKGAYGQSALDLNVLDAKLLAALVPESQRISVANIHLTLDQTNKTAAQNFIRPELEKRFKPDQGEMWYQAEPKLPHIRFGKVDILPRIKGPWAS